MYPKNNMKNYTKQTFEDYLQDQAQEDDSVMMAAGSDGNQEATERFIENIDTAEMQEYAEEWGRQQFLAGMDRARDIVFPPKETI